MSSKTIQRDPWVKYTKQNISELNQQKYTLPGPNMEVEPLGGPFSSTHLYPVFHFHVGSRESTVEHIIKKSGINNILAI